MRGIFVTGTDTGVGKTLFAAAVLLRLAEAGISAAAAKPVSAGCRRQAGRLINADAELLAGLAGVRRPIEVVNPFAFEPAIAPHIAAAEAGVELDARRVVEACREAGAGADFLVVEGAGGWRVPLTGAGTMAEIAAGLGLPVVLVVGMRLGCLSHALLTFEAVRQDGLELAGWVANVPDPGMPRLEANIATLAQRIEAPQLARLPACSAPDEAARARQAALALPADLPAMLLRGIAALT